MSGKDRSLGLDIGATAVKAAMRNEDGSVTCSYLVHHGEPEDAIRTIIAQLGEPATLAITGSGGRRIATELGATYIDPSVALIAAGRDHPGVRHIIDIGGGSLSIVDLDEEGRFSGFRTNSLCAAGTGSFLDEQAARMGLGVEEMSSERAIKDPPRIAARCAVFAKSDLIHRQQEGYSIPEMWSGLCRGMVNTAMTTLFRGRRPAGKVLVAGGVAQNREVIRWLKSELAAELIVPEGPETFSARGALHAARAPKEKISWETIGASTGSSEIARREKLSIEKSVYPSFACEESYMDAGTEVRLHSRLAGEMVMGLDIGSTSTKAALLDLSGKVVADFYRRTSGDPINATQKILSAISNAARGADIRIVGAGTTGSGRKMVGAIIGADRIINEITAHVQGALADSPDVETIFEIGGQDAKFISLRCGAPHDSNMNYVCAAGTGSFVEEQAGKLGFALTEIGDAVMGTEPPYSSDRCTVFMEQDVHALIRAGFERREVMGSVLYSVVQNYLNRVVGRRPYSKRNICFMGATARNRGLVAAFEKLLGAPIAVSPYCHVMGAYGVGRIVLEEVVRKAQPTTFRGLGFAGQKVGLERSECSLCTNLCRITSAVIGGCHDSTSAPSWGYMCGRDPSDKSVRVGKSFEAFRRRERVWKKAAAASRKSSTKHSVGLPQALLMYGTMPLWSTFFNELGVRTIISRPTDEATLASATDWVGSDYCYPVKLAHGHIRELSENPEVTHVFLPYIVQDQPHDDGFKRSVYCPYNIAFPSIAKGAELTGPEEKEIISAVLNLQLPVDRIIDALEKEIVPAFGVTRGAITRAWAEALKAQREFETGCESIGAAALKQLEESDGSGIVILGRPYNVHDLGANLNLPSKIADLGLTVLSVDMLPLKDVEVPEAFNNMYWKYGRKILQAAKLVAANPRLHAVFLTNFGCGPDSFLQTFVERIMRGKPMLMLELDEHSADAGYITRLEAFRDVIKKGESREKSETCETGVPRASPAYRTLWIPPMHPYGSSLLAAAMRSVGLPTRPLPPETVESFALAKAYCRGTECVPAPATIGAFLDMLRRSDAPEREGFFMPSAKGPCRFGQYHTLHRLILDEAGYQTTNVEAWSDESGTYGTGLTTSRRCFNAVMAADLLFKARCRVRPYAKDREGFDRMMQEELSLLEQAAESGSNLVAPLAKAAGRIARVERSSARKPLVGIVGEIYVRLNPFTNCRLIETIEDAGGEAWVAPMTEWFHYLAFLDAMLAREDKLGFFTWVSKGLKNAYMMHQARALWRSISPVAGDRPEPPISSTIAAGEKYLPRRFDGESILTVGRAVEFAQQGVSLIINCAPFGCMPGALTAGIFQRMDKTMGVPVVSLFFDGETDLSHLVRTYMSNLTHG